MSLNNVYRVCLQTCNDGQDWMLAQSISVRSSTTAHEYLPLSLEPVTRMREIIMIVRTKKKRDTNDPNIRSFLEHYGVGTSAGVA